MELLTCANTHRLSSVSNALLNIYIPFYPVINLWQREIQKKSLQHKKTAHLRRNRSNFYVETLLPREFYTRHCCGVLTNKHRARSWGVLATRWKDSQRLLKDSVLSTFSSSVLAALTPQMTGY